MLVVDCVNRSFAAPQANCWRFQWPLYQPVSGLDPTELLKENSRANKTLKATNDSRSEVEIFADTYVAETPKTANDITLNAKEKGGVPLKTAAKLLSAAFDRSIIKRKGSGTKGDSYYYFRGNGSF